MKKCGKCRYRCYSGWGGMMTLCIDYERAETEEDEIRAAADCRKFKEGTPDCLADKDRIYTPSATGGDYSPSSPWNAPGMSVRDFI